jgi:hypothetical protein
MIEKTTANLQYSASYLKTNQTVTSSTQQKDGQAVSQENVQKSSDQVTLTYSSQSSETTATYNMSMSLESKAGDGFDLLRGLVLNIFKEQGLDYTIATDDAEIDISTITPEEAQALIADDGYFGVEKTSERIFNFAVGMAGNDPGRIDAIRQGVEDGFQEALDAFGGWLPDISYDTYDAVMQKLDDWAGGAESPQSNI